MRTCRSERFFNSISGIIQGSSSHVFAMIDKRMNATSIFCNAPAQADDERRVSAKRGVLQYDFAVKVACHAFHTT
tara:strand:+ start:134 stop:358 length:225 start_codon:yes stop_codon:yes gene_type:complete